MKHVREIQVMVDQGQTSEAYDALEVLLELGPNNTEALKLRALLFARQGRFVEEAKCWEQVLDIDREDEDAITYFRQRHMEDREHFYFTDDLEDGGRKFIAYPKNLIRSTLYALIGCLSFLAFSRISTFYPVLETPAVLLTAFTVLVLFPWFGTIFNWIKALRSISLTRQRFEVATRFKTHFINWSDVKGVYLAHDETNEDLEGALSLILVPKSTDLSAIEVDLSVGSSSIRARSFFVKEVATIFGEPKHTPRGKLELDENRLISF